MQGKVVEVRDKKKCIRLVNEELVVNKDQKELGEVITKTARGFGNPMRRFSVV